MARQNREKQLIDDNRELRRQIDLAGVELRRLRGLLEARPAPGPEITPVQYARWHNMVVMSNRKARAKYMEDLTNRVLDQPIEEISDEVLEIIDRIAWGEV